MSSSRARTMIVVLVASALALSACSVPAEPDGAPSRPTDPVAAAAWDALMAPDGEYRSEAASPWTGTVPAPADLESAARGGSLTASEMQTFRADRPGPGPGGGVAPGRPGWSRPA